MKKVILFLVYLVGNIGFSQSVDDDPTLLGFKIGEEFTIPDGFYRDNSFSSNDDTYNKYSSLGISTTTIISEQKINYNKLEKVYGKKREVVINSPHKSFYRSIAGETILISISSVVLDRRENDYIDIIDKYTIKFGTPTDISSNNGVKKWTWVGNKNIFIIEFDTKKTIFGYTLKMLLSEKEYYLR